MLTDDVVSICQNLLRIDSTNPGDNTGPGERAAAEYVMTVLTEAGLDPEMVESDTRRANVMVRIPGREPELPALCVHGHLDVVPAIADEWQHPPFAGEIVDGMLWGRGAVDMKDMDAMILAVILNFARTGTKPRRDLVVVFTADEEAGGGYGMHWLVNNRREWFEGVTEAISEVGGFNVYAGDKRIYLMQTAEKGILWLRLIASGTAGHGSQVWRDNAVVHLAEAVTRIGQYQWPTKITPPVQMFLDQVSTVLDTPLTVDDMGSLMDQIGPTARWVDATLRNTSNPTVINGGYKQNVIPASATALVDCRFLPGDEEHVFNVIRDLAGPHVRVEVVHRDISIDAPLDTPLFMAMQNIIMKHDPGAYVVPYCLAGGTDNKALTSIGIHGYGFAPLKLPPDLDFSGMFHSVNERVPVESLQFGVKALADLLDTY